MPGEVTLTDIEKLLKAYYPNYRWFASHPETRDTTIVILLADDIISQPTFVEHEISHSTNQLQDAEFRSQYLRQLGADLITQFEVKENERRNKLTE